MLKSLMIGLDNKNLEAVIRQFNLKDFYYPTLFPLRETQQLNWKMIETNAGARVAADIVSRGATSPRKLRETLSKIQGDIPKLSVSRELLEEELTDYNIALALANGNSDLKSLVEFWADDAKFCFQGVAARAEWIALRQISRGKVRLDSSNNAAVVTEFDVDYQIPREQLIGVSTPYTTSGAAKPLTVDIPNVLKAAKAKGISLKYMFMNVDTYNKLAAQEEVVKRCGSLIENLTGSLDAPDLNTFNSYLSKKNELYRGLKIVVIDQNITIEKADGSRLTGNPFEDDVILFSESKELGKTFWKKPIDAQGLQGSPAVRAMHGHTLIKKYSVEEPIQEVTIGEANLFPAWNLAGRSILMQTNHTSWNKD